jgi:hypothetical protein
MATTGPDPAKKAKAEAVLKKTKATRGAAKLKSVIAELKKLKGDKNTD